MTKKKEAGRASPADLPPVITPDDIASVTGQHPNVVRRQCADGTIPAVRVGSRWYIGRDIVFGELIPQPVVVDSRTADKIVDAIKETLAAGKPVALEIRGAGSA